MRWTIPNILTLFRLIAAPAVPLMFLYFQRPWADWAALTIFLIAAITDWLDGYLARAWQQESRFGAAMDPIADKAMVVIAIVVITGYSGMNPWLILPAAVILFREVFVSGLREFLGPNAKLLKVTKLAKWKTTFQMVAISVLFLGTGLAYVEHGHPPLVGEGRLPWSDSWSDLANQIGLALIWLAAILTGWTGWDYFVKAMPYLKEPAHDA
ncbi:CDP-diacylglycerol--glycerol-3-phosphate 3-phosphatidyltransferase [Paracoccus sp. R12_1]|uniref:CDP-diacylglycerol--glycerol-3-phosphate 3-phosphatidyltransferase n=1 Tax=unclassified Paracoccus (in: a-proteobacteria) TaxID=2688777 RepID=UPI000C0B80FC|nr:MULTISPECIES: CDP-diacylglycerol--glycerol-3-phosphate 3-phosphatidyltransferase [unclassified Paracoccus (in: a-proteobacteria)]MBO9455109.1 CDP-diacylglycerol--glycerol-3-phosphate 3-phosphatidyltransferase [Paracoccus sp. R12_2]MBO9486519.1 CDP-diacylglycerol--glycerol-3-phosphate 3-phosphatidyltransferase [Paracoccus sp. R12_1]PHQ69527.1 MAG: CDP-diacylglycerol--glycerol-3-phosphate 3-phosphatidyltransferase [Paracoccus sp. (in: a-proteobacteria)]